MKITFLGTGAADWPYLPEEQENTYVRRTCSIWINDHVLVDPAAASYRFAVEHMKLPVQKLTDIYLTHTHNDHYDLQALQNWVLGAEAESIRLHYHRSAEQNLKKENWPAEVAAKLTLCPMRRKECHQSGELSFINLLANHHVIPGEEGSLFAITEKGEKDNHFFYGLDTGWFPGSTWDALRKMKFELIVLDGTVGPDAYNWRIGSHNNLAMNELLLGAMKKDGILAEDGRAYLSHFARTEYPDLEESRALVQQIGFEMVEDGTVLTVE